MSKVPPICGIAALIPILLNLAVIMASLTVIIGIRGTKYFIPSGWNKQSTKVIMPSVKSRTPLANIQPRMAEPSPAIP